MHAGCSNLLPSQAPRAQAGTSNVSTELWRLPAHRLASLIAQREVSSREVVQAHLERIAAVNPQVNAITLALGESALAAADAADRNARNTGNGPLHGVPFSIKENLDLVGTATTNGVPAFAHAMPTSDSPVVARMKAAGAIPLARTNLPEMGLRLSTNNPLRGRTLNPWNPALTSGGSSGGCAVALATGMSPFSLGNDIGGSLRNPAYCCGIAALKPTQGRIPHAGSLPPQDGGMAVQLMLVEGPMARSVADLRLGLSILAGADRRDPISVDVPLQGAPAPARAALVTRFWGKPLPAATLAAIRAAGKALAEAGWEVEEVEPPELERVQELWGRVLSVDFTQTLPQIRGLITPELHANLDQVCRHFDPATMPNLVLHAERSRLMRAWSGFFAQWPLAVGPTWGELPWPVDADIDPVHGLELLLSTWRFISPGNVLGIPSVALPTGVADGLPTGVQIYADRWREDLCLNAAEIIEATLPGPAPIDPRG